MATATMTDVRAKLAEWKSGTGTLPFGNLNSPHASERSGYILTHVSSLLEMFSAAASDSQTLTSESRSSEFDLRNCEILASALDGIGMLVDLANVLLED